VERESVKKRKSLGDAELTLLGSSSGHVGSSNHPSTSKAKPEVVKIQSIVPVTGKNKLTRQLFEQIPFLEHDPLKALEMLKKMVQESGRKLCVFLCHLNFSLMNICFYTRRTGDPLHKRQRKCSPCERFQRQNFR
jgi:hypothetical protein